MFGDVVKLITDLIHDAVNLVIGLAWPLAIVALAFLFRRELPALVSAIAKQGVKLSAAGVAVEIAPAAGQPAPERDLASLGEPVPWETVGPSGTAELNRLISATEPVDYMVIDLKEGKSWLTSRLYLFALLLRRMRAVQEFVFVETHNGIPRMLLAHGDLNRIRWRLAQRQPWLEAAYASAYAGRFANQPAAKVTSDSGALEVGSAQALVTAFLQAIQRPKTTASPSDGWVELKTPTVGGAAARNREEHGDWINGASLQTLFDGVLIFDPVTSGPDARRSDLVAAILRRQTRYVSLVETRGQFTQLIDRGRVLEQVAAQVSASMQQSTPSSGTPR